jgi:hypothetical protein
MFIENDKKCKIGVTSSRFLNPLPTKKKSFFFILFKKVFVLRRKKKVFCFHLHLSNLSGNKKDEKFNKNDRRKEGRNVVKKGLSNKNVNPNYLSVLKAFSS